MIHEDSSGINLEHSTIVQRSFEMCSITEEDFVSPSDQIVEPSKLDLVCKKCHTEKAMVRLQKRHSYCRDCFMTMVSHKFRSTLGKTKLMKNDEKVLCVFHGNQASIALSYLLKQGTDEKTHKRLRFRTLFLFIDESPLRIPGIYCTELSEIFKTLQTSGFDCFFTKLSSIYDQFTFENFDSERVIDYLLPNENDDKLSSLFHDIKNNTSKIEMLWRLRYQLYFAVAKSLQCQKIFSPECGTDLSIRLLSNVALGRGSQIASDVAVCDKKFPDVFLIRPLREITLKELAFFNIFSKLDSSVVNPVYFMSDTGSSLQKETESFIYNLQEEFPSTVYTIFHTGDKLKMTEKSLNEKICYFCFNSFKLKDSTSNCSKENSVTSIEEIGTNMKNCSNCDCRKNKSCGSGVETLAKEMMCYACQHILADMQSMDNFPAATVNEMKLQSHMTAMRKEIEDFLL